MKAKDRIIVALDVDSLEKVRPLVEELSPHVGAFKVGLELLTAVGAPRVVKEIHDLGGQVFLDGKFDDIPATVQGAARAAAKLGVWMFNVHACAGPEAMRAAAAVKGDSILLAVTVLTSLNDDTAIDIFGASSLRKVLDFAKRSHEDGADGIVCSPRELEALTREPWADDLFKVTPGVRPEWADTNDQKRVMTPLAAIRAGATHLVIGRPITQPPREIGSPIEAAKRIVSEIEKGFS